jgi:hypothetical protein
MRGIFAQTDAESSACEHTIQSARDESFGALEGHESEVQDR